MACPWARQDQMSTQGGTDLGGKKRRGFAVCYGINSTVLYFRGGQVNIMEKLGETVQQVTMKWQQRLSKSHTHTY
jgi:hypothetical protein